MLCSVPFRGTHSSRLVQCFSSHPLEMQLHPVEPFMLPANAMQEIHVGVRPQQVRIDFRIFLEFFEKFDVVSGGNEVHVH